MKQLTIYAIVSFIILVTGITLYVYQSKPVQANQTAQEANINDSETYEYVVTSINNEGIHGKSTTDHTGIFLVKSNLPQGMQLHKNDKIKVSFPNDDYETITSVQKVNNSAKLINESFTIKSTSDNQYKATNNRTGTDKDKLYFSQSDIKSNKSYHVGDTITATYKQLKGEDQFVKVK